MDGFKMRRVSSMEKVFPQKEPSGEGMRGKLMAFKGETVSFQTAFSRTGEGTEMGTVEVDSPLKDRVRVRMVQLVPCEYPCHQQKDEGYLTDEPGLYPDLLTEIPPWGFPVVNGQWRSLWIDIENDGSVPAGEYPVEIQLKCKGKILGSTRMWCEILDTVLPKLPVCHTEWVHTDCLANYYGVEVFSDAYWEITENFIKTAVKRNCNMILTPVFTPPLDTAPGGERLTVQLVDVKAEGETYIFGFDKFEKWVAICQRCGMEYFEISHLFTQWGAGKAPKIMGEKDGKYRKLFGWKTEAAGKEYAEFLHQFLSAFKTELKKLDIEDKVYFHVSDEPSMSQIESYRAAKNIVSEELKDYVVFDALSDYDFYKEGLVSQPVCALDHMEPFIKNHTKDLWGYYCTAQWKDVSNRFIVLPGYRTRILGLQMYKYRLRGFLHWGYNFYNSQYSLYSLDPYRCTDAGGAFPSGDAFLVYPGKNGKPEESIRLMLMDEAMNDLRALYLLESLEGRDAAMKCLESCPEERITFEKYPQSVEYLERCRERVNKKIKELIY
ncbi:MAG: DUF4091 domain-containing protein [Blautia sp.]